MQKLHKLKLLAIALLLPSLLQAAIIPTPLPFILQNGQTADATQVMSDFNAIVTNVNANAASAATSAQTNVTNTFTQPQVIPNGTGLGYAINVGQVDQNATKYVTDTGAANAYVAAPSPAWVSYIGGSDLFVKIGAGNTSTGAATINVNALGVKNILNQDGATPEANALLTGQTYHLIYDGTSFLIIGKNGTAPTQAVTDNSTKIATTGFVYLQVPAGAIMDFAGTATPTGWILCDGSSLLRAGTYAALFTAIGTTWGSVDGTHFTVPDLRGRATIDDGTGSGLTARTVGQTGGEETHLLSTAEMPAHTHGIQSKGNVGGATTAQGTNGGGGPVSLDAIATSTGGGGTHNVMMPFAVVRKIIKY